MAVRIALQCSEADSRIILADENSGARLLVRPGEAIYNDDDGKVGHNDFFQVAWLPEEGRKENAAIITELIARNQWAQKWSTIVFEGNAIADISRNEPLTLASHSSIPKTPTNESEIWLGEPIAIKPPTRALIKRQGGSHLLIVGQDEISAAGMMISSLLSLLSNYHPSFLKINLLYMGSVENKYSKTIKRIIDSSHFESRFSRRRGSLDELETIYEVFLERLNLEEEEIINLPTVIFAIFGLQRARDFRQIDDFGFSSYSDEPSKPSPTKMLAEILKDGPEMGIHLIVWCDALRNINNVFERRSISEFDTKVVMQMTMEDSSNLIDTPVAGRLGLNRAYLYSEEYGTLEKFRPYAPPSNNWLSSFLMDLKKNLNA